MFWAWLRKLWRGISFQPMPAPPKPIPKPEPALTSNDLLNEINRVRAQHNRRPLKLSECLEDQSLEHCRDMHERKSRTGDHEGFPSRLAECEQWGGSENVAKNQRTGKRVVEDWMTSKRHRQNILGDWDECGADRFEEYWCAIFA